MACGAHGSQNVSGVDYLSHIGCDALGVTVERPPAAAVVDNAVVAVAAAAAAAVGLAIVVGAAVYNSDDGSRCRSAYLGASYIRRIYVF